MGMDPDEEEENLLAQVDQELAAQSQMLDDNHDQHGHND